NIAAGLLCSYAIGGSQSRTLLNDATGGRTQMVSLLAATLTTIFVFLCAPWIATIPSVAIAAILIFTAVTLFDLPLYSRLQRLHHFSMIVAVATTLGVIVLGVLSGILLGVVLSLLGVLAQTVRPQDALLGSVEGSSRLHDVGDDEIACTIPGLIVYRFYGSLIFANARFFIERIESFIAQETDPVRQVILDARAIPSIDLTAAEQLSDYVERLRGRGIEFVIVKAHLPLRETLARLESRVLNDSKQFSHLSEAIAMFRGTEVTSPKRDAQQDTTT
ncbi:MAG: STAS domain-containing protein, partial [Saprospiraceae bacterium]